MEETHELKLFTSVKFTDILVDDQDIALYMHESIESKQFFCTKNPPPHTLVKDKVLYAYMRVTQTMDLTPMFIDKFAILYEPMDNRAVQDLPWHGRPVPKFAPMVTTSSHPRENVNDKRGLNGLMYDNS